MARRHLPALRFSAGGTTIDPFFGVSERSRSVSLARYAPSCASTDSVYALSEAGSPLARSQHLVGHFKKASNRVEEMVIAEGLMRFFTGHKNGIRSEERRVGKGYR